MKAMQLKQFAPIEAEPLEPVELPLPEPGTGEVRIKVKVCGVCHTDLHTVEGDLPEVRPPLIPGHQIVGVVDCNGPGAVRFKPGERIGAAWLHYACGTCPYCLKDRENLCESARFTGFSVNGGYAEYSVVPEKFVYSIPEIFSDQEASPLLCAGIIGYRALRLSEIRPGGRLGLYGFGASAHVAIQIALHWGCEIYVFSRGAAHREHARSLGAVWAGNYDEDPPAGLDASINFTPAGSTVLEGLRHLDKGGVHALAGIHMSPVPEMDYGKYLYHERSLRSVANATRRDGEELLAIAAEIPIRTTTRPFKLEEANLALRLVKESRIDGAAVLKIS